MNHLVQETEKPGLVPSPFERLIVDLPGVFGELHRSTIDSIGVTKIQAAITRAEECDATVEDELGAASALAPRSEVARALQALVSAWPNASQNDLAGFSAQLGLEMIEARPSRYALTTGCSHLKRTSRFLPSIAEVLGALADAEAKLSKAVSAHRQIPALLKRARAALEAAKESERRHDEIERLEREEDAALRARRASVDEVLGQ